MVIRKKVANASQHISRWKAMHPTVRPKTIKLIDHETIEYEFIRGHTPTDWRHVYQTANKYLWTFQLKEDKVTGVEAYCKYVIDRARMLPSAARITQLMRMLDPGRLTPVGYCHQDLTLKNCVQTPDHDIIFLDPGTYRGLACREIDEAKILQSLDGFDSVMEGTPVPATYGFTPRREHLILLVSHYVRLFHHVKHNAALGYAARRIDEICDLWL